MSTFGLLEELKSKIRLADASCSALIRLYVALNPIIIVVAAIVAMTTKNILESTTKND